MKEGDQELAYVYLMRYFHLLQLLRTRPDLSRGKHFVEEQLGDESQIIKQMDQLEQIKTSLEKRYAPDQTIFVCKTNMLG